MNSKILALSSPLSAVLLLAGGAGPAVAQDRCKTVFNVPAADTSYPLQHTIDVGDVPAHQVRIFELKRKILNAQANCEGHKVVESRQWGYSDYVERNGRSWGYGEHVLDSGDKIFFTFDGTTQTVAGPDGSPRSTFTGIDLWKGGTGKYQSVRGIERQTAAFNPDKNFNEAKFEAEYWLEK
jgi:hypothetical protein